MIKVLTALAALTLGMPAIAGTAHDFDPSRVSSVPQRSLDGQCYDTQDDSKVCFFRITEETFAVTINDTRTNSEYPHVFYVNCDTGRYRGYGPMADSANNRFAVAFCDNGRY